MGELGLFTGRKRFAECYKNNGCRGKVFGYDALKLWCWRGQRKQQTAMRGRAGNRFNNTCESREGQGKKGLTGYPHACSQTTRIQRYVPLGCGKTHVVYPPEQPEPTWLWNGHTQIAERGHASCVTNALKSLASSAIARHNSPLPSTVAYSLGVKRVKMSNHLRLLRAVNWRYTEPMSYWPPEGVVYSP